MNKIKKLIAFTLAETLIVMGIIGIVAALTIPNVNKNTGEAEKVAKVKKIYAELSEAHDRATAVYGPIEKWFVNDNCSTDGTDCENARKRYFDRITEFMKVQKSCRDNNDDICIQSDKKLLHGGNVTNDNYRDYPSVILSSNTSFSIGVIPKPKCNSASSGYQNYCGFLFTDIDGPNKGKNSLGTDLFVFSITKNGIRPSGGGTNWTNNNIKSCAYSGSYCAEWVIRNGNMDYLDTDHIQGMADADKGICKNGKQLSTTVSSCK
ncbi:type II secretion system protein [bacterium]|nr:type II secretion system protein [bacterium]